jgi:hypothetical protein
LYRRDWYRKFKRALHLGHERHDGRQDRRNGRTGGTCEFERYRRICNDHRNDLIHPLYEVDNSVRGGGGLCGQLPSAGIDGSEGIGQ